MVNLVRTRATGEGCCFGRVMDQIANGTTQWLLPDLANETTGGDDPVVIHYPHFTTSALHSDYVDWYVYRLCSVFPLKVVLVATFSR